MNSCNNGYDVISGISQHFSELESEMLQMEKDLRELEIVNDQLEEENEYLRKELDKAADLKSDECIDEIKQLILNALKECSAEDIKNFIVREVTKALTGHYEDKGESDNGKTGHHSV